MLFAILEFRSTVRVGVIHPGSATPNMAPRRSRESTMTAPSHGPISADRSRGPKRARHAAEGKNPSQAPPQTGPPPKLPLITDPSVAIDRADNAYVLGSEHTADNSILPADGLAPSAVPISPSLRPVGAG